jgi:hypothetical protein
VASRRLPVLAAIMSCLAFVAAPSRAETLCGTVLGRPLPITSLRTGLGAVPATVGNRDAKLVIDTGAAFSLLDDRLAADLHLPHSSRSNASLFGGFQITDFVTVGDLRIGDRALAPEEFGVFSQLAGDGVQGTLGAPALAHNAFDLDFPGSTLRFIAPTACRGGGADLWTFSPVASVSWRQSGPQILFMVTLDGEDLLAILDSGADHSSMDLHTAKSQLGLGSSELSDLGAHQINGGDVRVYGHRFSQLEAGDLRLAAPDVQIVAIPHQKRGPQLILGADFLRRVRVFVDWERQKTYFAAPLRP